MFPPGRGGGRHAGNQRTARVAYRRRVPVPVTLNQPELAVVRVVNLVRAAHGLASLRPTPGLMRVARSHSADQMRHRMVGHTASNGSSFAQRVARAGRYRTSGEVVAWTSRRRHATARGIVRMWMASPPHRAALLDPRFRSLGVGRAHGRRGTWVTADLAGR